MDIKALQPLPSFSWQREPLRAVDKDFFSYYGINFENDFPAGFDHRFGVMPLAAYQIVVHYFSLASNHKTIVLIHGYYDHVGLYGHLIKILLQQGYNVLAYDLPGHGLSSGEQAGIPDFADYQSVLKALLQEALPHLPKPLYLIGQSTGGSIAMDYVLNNPQHEFEKMVLLAPLVIPRQWYYLKFIIHTLGHFLSALPRHFVRNSHDDDFLHFLEFNEPLQSRYVKRSWGKALMRWQSHFLNSPLSALPVLLIQGNADTTVDWRYNLQQIRKKFTSMKVVMIAGGMHHLVNESPDYREKIFSPLIRFLQAG